MSRKNEALKVVSLFAGCGGIDYGLKKAGYEIAWANDIDSDACATYRANVGSIVEGDITKIEIPKLKDISLLTAGFPCQPFSSAGTRSGVNDKRGVLFEKALDFVEEIAPKAVLFENVRGLLSAQYSSKRLLIDEIVSRLESMGYYVKYSLVNFLHLGVPQHRVRLMIVAIRDRDYLPTCFPEAEEHDFHTIKTTLSGLSRSLPNQNEKMQLNPQAIALGSLIPEGGSWKDLPFKSLPERWKKIRKDMTAYGSPRFYRRCDRNDIMTTITAKFTPEIAAVWHPTKDRIFTVREVARFQSFPDDFVFHGRTIKSKYLQIGNAIPPKIGLAFGRSLMPYFLKSPLKSIQQSMISCSNLAPNKVYSMPEIRKP